MQRARRPAGGIRPGISGAFVAAAAQLALAQPTGAKRGPIRSSEGLWNPVFSVRQRQCGAAMDGGWCNDGSGVFDWQGVDVKNAFQWFGVAVLVKAAK